jgi:hypothetical protein
MQQPIVIQGRTITVSNVSENLVTFTLNPTDTSAARATGKGGKALLIDRIVIAFTASGSAGGGTFTSDPGQSVSIVAQTPRVSCEGKQLLTEGDAVDVNCTGTVVVGMSSSNLTVTAKFTITDGVQKNVDANKS